MNLVRFAADQTPARYLRITATELWKRREDFVFALAEVQAFSNGRNVALGAAVEASDALTGDAAWSPAALTDGRTETGTLVSLPEWFDGLELRRVLEAEREQLVARRFALVERAQRVLVKGSVGSVAGVSLLSGILLWRQRRARRRDAQRLHDKLARDLHDEIGSNLGSIRLICSFANQPDSTPEAMRNDLGDIERVAAESADSMRDMVQLISPRRAAGSHDWLDVLQGLTERLLRGHTLDCALPAAPLVREPDLETRRELYLFCKEVLHNIVRHAHATRVRFHLLPTADGLRLEISDDGAGFDPQQASAGHGLGKTMRAAMNLQSQPGHGTTIRLDVPKTPRWQPR
jgi:signal transduction histidine kinase